MSAGATVLGACDLDAVGGETIGDDLVRQNQLESLSFYGWQDNGTVFVPVGSSIDVVQPGHKRYQVVRYREALLDFDPFTRPMRDFPVGTVLTLSAITYAPARNPQHDAWLAKLKELHA